MKISMLVLMITGFCFTPFAEAVDPNINTQSSDLRSNGSNGQPGFNPCLGGTRSAAGVCSATAATTLLSTVNMGTGGVMGRFGKLGPGAVTDNMFGLIEQPLNPASCTSGIITVGFGDRLNCGPHAFFPFQQRQTLPSTPDGTNGLAGAFTSLTTLQADFCANGGADCLVSSLQNDLAHVGFDFSNSLSWTPIDAVQTNIVATQSIVQVTGLGGSAGTFASPGSGEERVEIVTSWSGISSASAADPFGIRPFPNVDFSQNFSAPDMAGTGGGFIQRDSGTISTGNPTSARTEFVTGETQSNGDATGILQFN